MSSTLTIGTAPDTWGVWFPSDPEQVSSGTFLADVAEAGYSAIDIVVIPEVWRDHKTGAPAESPELPLSQAVRMGAIEHDLDPCPPDVLLPIAPRTRAYRASGSGATLDLGRRS